MIAEALRLEENLVRVARREALHLILDRRAVAGAPTLDRSGEQRRAAEVRANDLVRPLAGASDRAAQLCRSNTVVERRHRPWFAVARLLLQACPIDRAA